MATFHSSPARPRQPDCRRRSRRAARLGRQGAGRERDRRRRAAHRDSRRARRQEAGPRRRRWRGDGAGGRAAGDRAARDEQDPARRRPRGDPHARLPRRGAARRSRRCRTSCCGRARAGSTSGTEIRVNGGAVASVDGGRRAPRARVVEVNDLFYNLPARRKFLKSDGAESAQVSRIVTQLALAYPEVGFTLTSAGAHGAAVPAGRDRCAIACIRSTASASDLIEVRKEAGGMRLDRLRRARWPSRGRRADRRTSSSTAGSSRTGRSRTRSSMPTAWRRSRSGVPRCTCSSRCRPTRSTSTCTRRRRKCGSAISRSCTRWCGAR